jgi:hypothetical protein
MSNKIRLMQGLEKERTKVVFANGEPVFCTDSLQLYMGDGNTKGGRPVKSFDIPYPRAAFSHRFNEFVEVSTAFEGLDKIFQFISNVSTNIYYGDVSTNQLPVSSEDISRFYAGLSLLQDGPTGPKDLEHTSNYTYRVISYPKYYGLLGAVLDPNLNYINITNSYSTENPQTLDYLGIPFYVYYTVDQCLNQNAVPKTLRYLIDYLGGSVVNGIIPAPVANPTLTIHQTGHGFTVGQWLTRNAGYYSLACANTEFNAEVVGVITRVLGEDDLILTLSGYVTVLANLLDGYTYFLSATIPGAVVTTPPTSEGSINKPLFIADSATSGFMINYRGIAAQPD